MEIIFMGTKQYKEFLKIRLIDKCFSSILVYLLHLEKYKTKVYKQ